MSQLVHDADRLAAKAHKGQRRAHGTAYIDHPRAVARLLRAFDDALALDLTEEAYATALLHDVVEDSDATLDTLAEDISPRVSSMVGALTKPQATKTGAADGGKAERNRAYFEALSTADDVVKLVKVADRVHNLSELHLCDDPKRAKRYLDETAAFVLPLAAAMQSVRSRVAMEAVVTDAIAAATRACLLPSDGTIARGLYPVITATQHSSVDDVKAMVAQAVIAGSALIQIRTKETPDRLSLLFVQAAADVALAYGARLVVNDRPDLAVIADTPFIHLGQQDLMPDAAATVFQKCGQRFQYGRSTHSVEDLDRALRAEDANGADLAYVAIGPVHTSASKRGHATVIGVGALRERIAANPDVQVCAVGGLTTAARIAEVAHAGATFAATLAGIDPRLTTDDGRHRRIASVDRAEPLTPNDLHEVRLRCRLLQAVFAGASAARTLSP